MINRAPVYCDICKSLMRVSLAFIYHSLPTATRIQVALNVGVPASTLCIHRLLYRVARMKAGTTDAENRRILLIDLLIGIRLPALQMIARE